MSNIYIFKYNIFLMIFFILDTEKPLHPDLPTDADYDDEDEDDEEDPLWKDFKSRAGLKGKT